MKDITIWRLQTNTDNMTDYSVSNYCINNGLITLGWSLNDKHLDGIENINKLISERQLISQGTEDESFEKYVNFVNNHNIYKNIHNIRRLKEEIKPFDLICMRNEGIYWLGLVGENTRYFFNSSEDTLKMDASNQRTNIKWFEIGGESDVPGVVTTAFIKGQTLQRINQTGVSEFSKYLINTIYKPIYDVGKLEKNSETFFNLISTNDCEDLLCMWLFKQYGYINIPSTCKSSTELYECVLINPNKSTNKEVYIQVKKGNVDLYYSDYKGINGEVWLFTTKGKIKGEKFANIKNADTETLFEFAMCEENDNLLPSKISKWRDLLNK